MEGWGDDLRKENVGKYGNRKKQKCYNAGTGKNNVCWVRTFPSLSDRQDLHRCRGQTLMSNILQ